MGKKGNESLNKKGNESLKPKKDNEILKRKKDNEILNPRYRKKVRPWPGKSKKPL